MSNNKIVIELPAEAGIKNIQSVYDSVVEGLKGKHKIVIKGQLTTSDLSIAQLILQLRKEYSDRIEFNVSVDSSIELVFLKAGLKFQ